MQELRLEFESFPGWPYVQIDGLLLLADILATLEVDPEQLALIVGLDALAHIERNLDIPAIRRLPR